MSTVWTDAEEAAHRANRDKTRVLQKSDAAYENAMKQMAQVGPRALLKIFPAGVVVEGAKGYFGKSAGMSGRSPQQIAKLLGLKPEKYAKGANIHRLKQLPLKHQFEVRGYTHFPDGVALPPGKSADPGGYGPGEGALQWELVEAVPMEFVCSLGPGEVLTLEKLVHTLNLSGASWWHTNQDKYPNSEKINALLPVFADKVQKFVNALRKAGADVYVSATRRNPARANLMYYCYKLGRGEIRTSHIPKIEGCDIVWDHGNKELSQAAAKEMAVLFKVVFEPSLASLHISGKAIDMTIKWSKPITIIDAYGREVKISGPGDGASSTALHKVGASYGVMKLLKDAPHWSINGH